MKKKFILPLLVLLPLVSCGNNSTSISEVDSTITPIGDLQRICLKIKNENNFTIGFQKFGYEGDIETRNFYFTDYSFQQGDSTYASGVAQGEGVIYRYTINDDDSIQASTPIVNSYTGIRYNDIYSYINGVSGFDINKLPTQVDSDGYYHYTFNENSANDDVIMSVFLRQTLGGEKPESLKIKVVGDSLIFDSVILTYGASSSNPLQLKVVSNVYDIGSTTNSQIKSYIDSGKTCKNPLDLKFYKVFNKYLGSNDNYTIELDSTSLSLADYRTKFTEYRTSQAILDKTSTSNSGTLLSQGALHYYTLDSNQKVNITSTPLADESTFYTNLFGEYRMSFSSFDYSIISGYIDDNQLNTYYITDSQFVSYFATLCQINIGDTFYTDSVKIVIDDYDSNKFSAYFDMYNKSTGSRYGEFSVKFYDVNTTKIDSVDDYLSLGDEPSSQSKDDLKEVLDSFKSNNYSLDFLSDGVGLVKAYYTSNYYFAQGYGTPTYNEGYLKYNDHIYSFTLEYDVTTDASNSRAYYTYKGINVSTQIDYASQYGMSLPGVGSFYSDEYSMNYISKFSEDLYKVDNYNIGKDVGLSYWKSSDVKLSQDIISYVFPSTSAYIPVGFGLKAKNKENDQKLSFIFATMSTDGSQQQYSTLTYYDINKTSSSVVENAINDWISKQ